MADSVTEVVSENLRRLRDERGISRRKLQQLLEDAGVPIHVTTLKRIEEGTQPVKIDDLVALAGIYAVSLEELTTSTDPRAEVEQLMREAAAIGRRADAPLRDLVAVMGELERFHGDEAEILVEGASEVLHEALGHLATAVVGLTAGLSSSSADEARYRLEEEMYVDRGEAEAEVERLDLKARVEEYLAGLHDGSR